MPRALAMLLTAILLTLPLAAPVQAGSVSPTIGYWVVAGTFGGDAGDAAFKQAQRLSACSGVEFGTDFSGKFATFRPGLMVVYAGGYRTQGKANGVKRRVQRCGAPAYVKFSRHNNGE
jgi:hypothetical protein